MRVLGPTGTATDDRARPLLLVIDPEPAHLDRVEAELQRGFGADFRVRGETDAADTLRVLDATHARGGRVALVLVAQSLLAAERGAVLERTRVLHPDARRALLVPWGVWADRGTAGSILTAMAVGDINYYVLRPWIERDELFRRTIAEFVQEWSRSGLNFWNDVAWVRLDGLPTPMQVGISTRYWQRSEPDDPRLTIEPDLPVPVLASDHFGGRDPALTAALGPLPPR